MPVAVVRRGRRSRRARARRPREVAALPRTLRRSSARSRPRWSRSAGCGSRSPADRRWLARRRLSVLALLPALVRPLAARRARLLVVRRSRSARGSPSTLAAATRARLLRAGSARASANGFLDFYDVRTPFDPRVHVEMRGVVLLAVFGFVLALGLAVAARRPVARGARPARRAPAGRRRFAGMMGALAFGALILLARARPARGIDDAPRPARRACRRRSALALAARRRVELVGGREGRASSTGSGGTPTTAPEKPVSVAYVWDAQYGGIRFPRKRTTVLEIKAPRRSLYWRAAVLDSFAARPLDRRRRRCRGDALAARPTRDQRARCGRTSTVLALSDTRLVGASVPVALRRRRAPVVVDAPGDSRRCRSGLDARLPLHGLERRAASRPRRSSRARGRVYPVELTEPGRSSTCGADDAAPVRRAGRAARSRVVPRRRTRSSRATQPLAQRRSRSRGGATTPYAAAVALEAWFRDDGGFTTRTSRRFDGGAAARRLRRRRRARATASTSRARWR